MLPSQTGGEEHIWITFILIGIFQEISELSMQIPTDPWNIENSRRQLMLMFGKGK